MELATDCVQFLRSIEGDDSNGTTVLDLYR